MIEERYEIENPLDPKSAEEYKKDFVEDSAQKGESYHLFILVHGFMGGPHDM